MNEKRIVAHLDMDAFFASVEERDSPQFFGLPIVVGSDPMNGKGRGVVSTANYKAREYGIRSATPISKAWQLSEYAKKQGKPGVVFLEPDFSKYEKASFAVMEIIKKYAEKIEPASIDEYYFDLSEFGYEKAIKICRKIKEDIKKDQKLTCSIGIGPNKLIAKISAGIDKPDGLMAVKPDKVSDFLNPLLAKEIPGIGPKTNEVLNNLGVKTVGDLRNIPEDELVNLFGKMGKDIFLKARGSDDSEIEESREVKSIGRQDTFFNDTLDALVIIKKFEELCEDVFNRFEQIDFKSFKTITVTVRFKGFITKNCSKTFKDMISKKRDFFSSALNLLLPFLDKRKNPEKRLIRLIGVRMENFE
ncbi:MAG: DNA polymerase IV [Candidatus Nealsonbacteria bacterium]|nr:DNA polymerase IV [Candidatus Nealsonbacteria bacterium]